MYYVISPILSVSLLSVPLPCSSLAPPLAPPSTAVHLPSPLKSNLQTQQLHNRWSFSLPSLKETFLGGIFWTSWIFLLVPLLLQHHTVPLLVEVEVGVALKVCVCVCVCVMCVCVCVCVCDGRYRLHWLRS